MRVESGGKGKWTRMRSREKVTKEHATNGIPRSRGRERKEEAERES